VSDPAVGILLRGGRLEGRVVPPEEGFTLESIAPLVMRGLELAR
jgi:hypothetical protein